MRLILPILLLLLFLPRHAAHAIEDSDPNSGKDSNGKAEQQQEDAEHKREVLLARVVRGRCVINSGITADPCFRVALLVYDTDVGKAFRTQTDADGGFAVLLPDLRPYHILPAAKSYVLDPSSPTTIKGGEQPTITLTLASMRAAAPSPAPSPAASAAPAAR